MEITVDADLTNGALAQNITVDLLSSALGPLAGHGNFGYEYQQRYTCFSVCFYKSNQC